MSRDSIRETKKVEIKHKIKDEIYIEKLNTYICQKCGFENYDVDELMNTLRNALKKYCDKHNLHEDYIEQYVEQKLHEEECNNIGIFNVKDNKILVIDPVYDIGDSQSAIVDNVRDGIWKSFVKKKQLSIYLEPHPWAGKHFMELPNL